VRSCKMLAVLYIPAQTLSSMMSNADFAYEDVVQGSCAAKLPASATLACPDVRSFEEAEAVIRSIAKSVRSSVVLSSCSTA